MNIRKMPTRRMMFAEFPAATAIFIIASLNLAYRPLWVIASSSVILFALFHIYLRGRYGINVPPLFLILAFAAVGIDTLGNHFRWYQHLPWSVAYDIFAHSLIPALLSPALIWLLGAWLEKLGYRLPLSVVIFIAVNVNFSLAGFYEITELWDDKYFGGDRIKELYDTSRDLQFDLLGCLAGSALTYVAIKIMARRLDPPFQFAMPSIDGKTRTFRRAIAPACKARTGLYDTNSSKVDSA